MSQHNIDFDRFLNPDILGLTPYVAGEQPKLDNLIKLNTNENPYPPSPKAVQAIMEVVGEDGDLLRLYPDPDSRELCQTIADYYQVDVSQVFVGNGSDEVLGHIFRTFFKPNLPVPTPELGYSFYPVYAELFKTKLHYIPLMADYSVNPEDYRFDFEIGGIIIANPNAPTGRALSLDQIRQIVSHNSDVAVIIDEAYVDFGAESALALIDELPNLVVCQTTSKSRALAGMRVGYAIAQPAMIKALDTVKNCFNSYPMDRLAQAAAIASFGDEAYFQQKRQAVIDSRAWLSEELIKLGFDVIPSMTSFVFAAHPKHDAKAMQAFLRERGIIVRHFAKPESIANRLRISIGTPEQNQAVITALRTLIG